MRHCHYKQTLVLSHANALCDYYNFDYSTSTQENNDQTEIHWRISLTLKIITSMLSFLPAFLHCENYIHQNVNSDLSLFPEDLLLAMFAQNDSCFCPDIKRWHFSLFNFLTLAWNHSIASKEPCSSLVIKSFKSEWQAGKVVSSA